MKKLPLLFLCVAVFAFSGFAQSVESVFAKGLAQYNAKQYEAAIVSFEYVTEKSPQYYQAFYNLGLCRYFSKQYDSAASAFQRVVAIKPDYTLAYVHLGNALDSSNRYDEAVSAYQKAINLEPNNISAYSELGIAHRNKKKYAEAVAAFKKVTSINPGSAFGFFNLGASYVGQKLYSLAIPALNEAIRLKPEYSEAYISLGNAYYNNKQYAESIPHYKKATELSPADALAHEFLGDAYLNTKQYQPAIDSFGIAIDLEPKKANPHYGLGMCYVGLKNKVLAQQQVELIRPLNSALAETLQTKVNSIAGVATTLGKKPKKSAARLKDEADIAKMQDFGFDGAVVVVGGSIKEVPNGKILLAVKRGDILSLVSREAKNNWYQVVEEKTGIEGWIDGNSVVTKFSTNTSTGPALNVAGNAATATANPSVSISNQEEKTTLKIRINGTLYQIPPQSTKVITVAAGKFSYYGWSPGIRPTSGNKILELGKAYSWIFKINRR